jgi:hypothetical protein
MQYNQPFGVSNPNAPYILGNPVTGTPGSIPPATAIEFPQREITNAIAGAGLTPSNDDLTQLLQAIKLLGEIPVCVDEGSINNLVINPDPIVTAYEIPLIFIVVVGNNCTAATTVNVSGIGTVPLTRITGAALSPNDIVANGLILIAFDGTKFQLISVPGSLAYPGPDSLWHYAQDSSATVNQIIVTTTDTVGAAWSNSLPITIKPAITNTNPTVTISVTSAIGGPTFPTVNITRGAGHPLQAGDLVGGTLALIVYDGVEAQLLNPQTLASGGLAGIDDITGPFRPYWISVNSEVVASPPGSPSTGDTYLIPIGASGAWASLVGQLAQWNGTAWVYRSYPKTSVIGSSATSVYYENIGSNIWVPIRLPSAGLLFFAGQL